MANRAAELRAREIGATVVERGRRHLLQRRPNGTLVYESSSASLHYNDAGAWQEINTDLVDSTDPAWDDEASALPYRVRVKDGNRRLYPRRDVTTEYIELGRPEFQRNNGTWADIPFNSRTRTGNTVSFHRADGRIDVVVGPDRLKINIILDNAPSRNVWRFPISLVGLTRSGKNIVSQSDGTTVSELAPFMIMDAAGTSREVAGTLTNHPTFDGAYEITPDLSGLVYPVTIDPTIDVAIAASLDDGHLGAFAGWNTNVFDVAFGEFWGNNDAYMRFAITGPTAGSTVTEARIDAFWASEPASTGTNVLIRADKQNDPSVPASAADMAGRTKTTASVAWNNIASQPVGTPVSTPSFTTVIQELWDAGYGLDGEHIQIFISNNSSTAGAIRQFASYDNVTYDPPVLHIEYTLPATTQTIQPATPDISNTGSWVKSTGGTTDLYTMLDETTADDNDYVESPTSPSAASFRVSLANPTTIPEVDTDHTIKWRARLDTTGGSPIDTTIALYQGSTLIQSFLRTLTSSTVAEYTETIGTTEAGTITDYNDLRLDISATEVPTATMPTVRSMGTAGVGTTSIAAAAMGAPAGSQTGDLYIAFVASSGAASNPAMSGWTALTPVQHGTALTDEKLSIFWKITTGAGEAIPAVTGTTNHAIGRVLCITAGTFDPANPIPTTSGGNTQAATTGLVISGLTTTYNNMLVISATAGALPDSTSTTEYASWLNATLSSITEHADNYTSGGNGGGIGVVSGQKAVAGTVNSTTATKTTSSINANLMLAIKGAPTAARKARITYAAVIFPEGTASTPVNVTDTEQIASTETVITNTRSDTITDTEQIASTETVVTNTRSNTITDTEQIASTETVVSLVRSDTLTDTQAVAVTEVAAIAETLSLFVTDTQQISQTETVVSNARADTVTDTEQISQVETVITNTRSDTVTDTEQIAATETVITNTRTNDVTDTQAVAATDETVTNTRAQEITDTEQIASTETVITTVVTHDVTDTEQIASTETVATRTQEITDTEQITQTETVVSNTRTQEATDTEQIAATDEAVGLGRVQSTTDTEQITSTETVITQAATQAATDTETIASIETFIDTTVAQTATDTQAVAVVESSLAEQGLEEFVTSDVVVLGSSESTETSAGHLAADTDVLDNLETAIIHRVHASTDTSTVAVTDSVLDKSASYLANDTTSVAVTEAESRTAELSNTDILSPSTTEIGSIGVQRTTTDTQSISETSQTQLAYTLRILYSADIQSIGSTESGSLGLPSNQTLQAFDQYTVAAAESVIDRTVSLRPDLRDVGAVDTAYLLIMRTVTDTGIVSASETISQPRISTQDQLALGVADNLQLFRAIELFDTNVLHGQDTVDLDIIYRQGYVMLQAVQQQAIRVGFSRIGRGW